jgi:hypothetical protein
MNSSEIISLGESTMCGCISDQDPHLLDDIGLIAIRGVHGSVRFRLKKPTEPNYINFVKY